MEVETARFVLTGYDERDIADTAEMMRDPAVHAFFYGVQARLAEPAEVFADVTRATFLTPFRQEQARTGLGGLAVRTRGTREWVDAHFAEPREVGAMGVYWFDDTGRGECRVPASFEVYYRDGDQWRPLRGLDGGPLDTSRDLHKDRYNQMRFAPVKTDALRMTIQLQEGFSAGILEWRIPSER